MADFSSNDIVKVSISEFMGPLNDIEEKFAPKEVYFKGNREIIFAGPRVSIIGTRHPTQKGLENAVSLTKSLVKHGVVIVSGLAKGIDTIAHETAIKENGKTIAVLGTPLDKFYPAENRELQEKIMKNHLAVSQFPIGSAIQRSNFPLRNRTMALLSHASIIVDAGEYSGTEHQGWEALRLGRPLYFVEDLIKNLKWPQKMLEYGAEVLALREIKRVLDYLPALKGEACLNAPFTI